MSVLGKMIEFIRDPTAFRALMSFYKTGYLREIGWFASFRNQKPVNEKNEPIPWVTYSFIDFISERLKKDMVLVEFGSGNSTYFYSKHVGEVFSVEHDKHWFEALSGNLPANVTLEHIELEYNGKYSTFVLDRKIVADVVIVDGRDRINCLKQSVKSLSPSGVVVLDDSERTAYRNGVDFMMATGFRRIDFWGIAPGIFFRKCTTIFYRPNNCIDL
jgi:hypothetical protein